MLIRFYGCVFTAAAAIFIVLTTEAAAGLMTVPTAALSALTSSKVQLLEKIENFVGPGIDWITIDN